MQRRRNPDLVGTVLVLGAVGVGGYFLYRTLESTIAGKAPPTAGGIGYQLGSGGGAAVAGAVQGGVTGVLSGSDICTLIATWRNQGAPVFSPFAIGTSSVNIGGGDPHNWSNFVNWATFSAWAIPPSAPPTCW